MSALVLAAAGTAATLGIASIPLAVAAVASPINRSRNARRNAAEAARAKDRTAELVAQIRRGADHAALVDSDPGKLAGAAHAVAAGLADWFEHASPEDLPFMQRVLGELRPILAAEQVAVPNASAMPPIQSAAALQLLLYRLCEAGEGPRCIRVSIAAGATAEAVRALPDGCVVDFNPLTEHDPAWHRRAQAEWVEVAQRDGMGGWIRDVHS